MNREFSWSSFKALHPKLFDECLPPESKRIFTLLKNKSGPATSLMRRVEETTEAFMKQLHDFAYLRGLVECKEGERNTGGGVEEFPPSTLEPPSSTPSSPQQPAEEELGEAIVEGKKKVVLE